MKLVASVRPLGDPEAGPRVVAQVTGLTLAEARMRLAREPPAPVALLEDDRADELARDLRRAGLATVVVAAQVPTDKDRILARSIALSKSGVTFTPPFGVPVEVAYREVMAVFRGARDFHSETETTEKVRRLSLGAAVMTGGVVPWKTSREKGHSSDVSTQQVILVYARDGRSVLIPDNRVDFSCLESKMQPSSTANMAELAKILRENAVGAFYDERLLRLGRRPLPFVFGSDSRVWSSTTSVVRTDTTASLDVLAEIMKVAVAEGMLP